MQRLIAVLGAAVLVLGAFSVWAFVSGARPSFRQEAVSVRVLRQAREQLGSRSEVRLIETGNGAVACGYLSASPRAAPVGFVSRPNRLLLSSDPLKDEFRQMVSRDCPRFPEPPAGRAVP